MGPRTDPCGTPYAISALSLTAGCQWPTTWRQSVAQHTVTCDRLDPQCSLCHVTLQRHFLAPYLPSFPFANSNFVFRIVLYLYIQYLKVPGPDYGTDIVDKCLWPTTSTGERWRGLRLCSAYRAYANLNPGLESRKTCSTKVIESDRLLLPGLQIQFRRGVGLTLILDRLTPTVNRIQFLSW